MFRGSIVWSYLIINDIHRNNAYFILTTPCFYSPLHLNSWLFYLKIICYSNIWMIINCKSLPNLELQGFEHPFNLQWEWFPKSVQFSFLCFLCSSTNSLYIGSTLVPHLEPFLWMFCHVYTFPIDVIRLNFLPGICLTFSDQLRIHSFIELWISLNLFSQWLCFEQREFCSLSSY